MCRRQRVPERLQYGRGYLTNDHEPAVATEAARWLLHGAISKFTMDLMFDMADEDLVDQTPWYRDGQRWPFGKPQWAEFEDVSQVAAGHGIPLWLIDRAIRILMAARGCSREEACDRLAFNLRRRHGV